MFFDNWKTHKKENISKTILWEYDTTSPNWDWNKMSKIVVQRVLEYGLPSDYYAMFQLYGGKKNVAEIAKKIPHIGPHEINWCCILLGIKREDLSCLKREQSRKALLNS